MSPSKLSQPQPSFGFNTISSTLSKTFYPSQASSNSLRRIDSVQDFSSRPKKSTLTLDTVFHINRYRSSPTLKQLHSSPASPRLNLDSPTLNRGSSFVWNLSESDQYTLQLEEIDDQFIIQPHIIA